MSAELRSLIEHDLFNAAIATLEKPPSHLYHYTGLDAFIGIVTGRGIWATSHRYMNDPGEVQYGIDTILRGCIEELDQPDTPLQLEVKAQLIFLRKHAQFDDVYVISFCEEPDLLNQWRLYGGGQPAVSLAFSSGLADTPFFARCIYEPEKQSEIIRRIIAGFERAMTTGEQAISEGVEVKAAARIITNTLTEQAVIAGAIIKRAGFAEEKEWRCFFSANAPFFSPLKYRSSRFGLVPYTTVPVRAAAEPAVEGGNALVIGGVVTGPGSYPRGHARDVSYFLNANSFDVPIKVSSGEFR